MVKNVVYNYSFSLQFTEAPPPQKKYGGSTFPEPSHESLRLSLKKRANNTQNHKSAVWYK